MREIIAGRKYRHFKNKMYEVIEIATHSETGEEYVVYKPLYGDQKMYIRPLDMFASKVYKEKYSNATQEYRFELIEE